MRTYAFALLGALVVPLSAAAVDFDFESGDQGWYAGVGADSGMTDFGASEGKIGFEYSQPSLPFDPMVISPVIDVDAHREHWLVLDVNFALQDGTPPQTFEIFFENELGGFIQERSRIFTVTPNLGWQEIIFNLATPQGGRDPWEGNVTRFRVDPGSGDATPYVGYRCEFERIAITDDTDRDTIPDDEEYFYFGDIDSADETTDHDSNGITDAVEIAFGLDPTVDEGEEIPAAHAWSLMLSALVVGLFGASAIWRRRTV